MTFTNLTIERVVREISICFVHGERMLCTIRKGLIAHEERIGVCGSPTRSGRSVSLRISLFCGYAAGYQHSIVKAINGWPSEVIRKHFKRPRLAGNPRDSMSGKPADMANGKGGKSPRSVGGCRSISLRVKPLALPLLPFAPEPLWHLPRLFPPLKGFRSEAAKAFGFDEQEMDDDG